MGYLHVFLYKYDINNQYNFLRFRVVAKGETKDVGGTKFVGFGSHYNSYPCAYLTAAAAIGMDKKEIDMFIQRLEKVFSKCKKKDHLEIIDLDAEVKSAETTNTVNGSDAS